MNATAEIRSYNDLLDVLVARKNELGLSNETLEEIAGVTRGHVDKVFGPSREKRMGWFLFGLILPSLALKLLAVVDEPQAKLMHARWERRNTKQIRVRSHEVNRMLLDHAKLEVFSEMGRRSAQMRTVRMDMEASVRRAAKARWRRESDEKKDHFTILRFAVFKRDNFTCQYCGRRAPEVKIHCDHVVSGKARR